jgi:CubicO group peptidase (beta-lactamase class C family)
MRFAFALIAGSAVLSACSGNSGSAPPATRAPDAAMRASLDAAPAATPAPTPNPSGFTITGAAGPKRWAGFDVQMQSFMREYGIRAAQLAVAKDGATVYSHAYTNSTDPKYMITQPTSVMRISSNSKAFVTAAITKLYAAGTISPQTRVYRFLGVTAPLLASQTPDPRSKEITVAELVDHTAGLPGSSGSDPEFNMFTIEREAGNTGPLTEEQYTAYLYGVALASDPGATETYSNDGYFLLQRVIERATHETYIDWIDRNVLQPAGIDDAYVGATAESGRRPDETACDDPNTGPSVLYPKDFKVVPDCYGGITVYEILPGPTSIITSAESLARFIGTHNVYGLGGRAPGYARDGSFVGSFSWMESLEDGYDYAFQFNTRVDRKGNEFDPTPLVDYFEAHVK